MATTCWIMEIIIPVEPDPLGLHASFCIYFVVGCSVNILGSLFLLPGKQQGQDTSYKYLIGILGGVALICSLLWFLWWYIKNTLNIHNEYTDNWHMQQVFQVVAYNAYLTAMAVGFNWARKRSGFY